MSYIFVKHPQEESEAPKNFGMGEKRWSWRQWESEGVDYCEKWTTQSNDWAHQL